MPVIVIAEPGLASMAGELTVTSHPGPGIACPFTVMGANRIVVAPRAT